VTFRPVPSRSDCLTTLKLVFPRVAFDPVLASPLSAAAVAVMIYVDAVSSDEGPTDEAIWARPLTCLWRSDEVLVCDQHEQRIAWRAAR